MYYPNTQNKGSVMVIVMLLTAVIAGLAVAYIATTTAQQQQLTSSIDAQTLYQTALSGLDIANAYLLSKYTASTVGWDTELVNSDTLSGNYEPGADSISLGTPITYVGTFKWCRNLNYHGSTFWAKLENNNDGGGVLDDRDGVLRLRVEAWSGGNAPDSRSQEVVLTALVSYRTEPYEPTSALVIGGSLMVFGNATIGGTNGSIQSNGSVTIQGSATVAGDVTAIGSITAPPGSIGGETNSGPEYRTNIPSINPPEYSYLATHIFKTNGLVYDQNDNLLATPTGWSYNAAQQKWSKTGNITNNGVYYFQGSDVDFGGSAGSSTSPMTITIIATGYIDVTGSPSLEPSPDGGGIALMAGKDLRIRGASGNLYGVGLYAAHEQVSLRGTPSIQGVLLAQDAEDVCSLVSTTSDYDVQIGGMSNITYNGALTTILRDGFPFIRVMGFKKTIKPKE
jgi:type II secretory pathway pseudopilin PulG